MSHDAARPKPLNSSTSGSHLHRSNGAPILSAHSSISSNSLNSSSSSSSSRNREKDRLFLMNSSHEEPTSPAAAGTASGKAPRFIDIDKIIATVDQLKIPDHVQKQRQQRAQLLKSSGVPSSKTKTDEPAVERLLMNIDQLKEVR